MFTRVEAAAMPLVSFLAGAEIAAYATGAAGLAVHPLAILIVAVACAAIACVTLWPRASTNRSQALAFGGVVAAVLLWALWLAWPPLLPIGRGPDLTHHLLLIDYIERTGRLVHDPSLAPFLGEMIDYTPGSHLLVVIAGRWAGADGLHAAHSMIAIAIALKAGVLVLIALRCLPAQRAQTPLALLAALLLFLPRAYTVGSFTHDWFLAQVVSELFAVAMWWAVVAWDQKPSTAAAVLFAMAGAAAFLAWPVWIGPLVLTFAIVAALRRLERPVRRIRQAAIAIVPIAAVALAHAVVHSRGAAIARTSGAVITPSIATIGALFVTIGFAGTIVAAFDRQSRTVALLIAAIALQSAALYALARTTGAPTPYLSLKMFYLAVYPLAVGGAVCIAWALRITGDSTAAAIGWALAVVLGVGVSRQLVAAPRPVPVITGSLYDAGRWARAQLPRECVDYLVADDDSAYWLHLAVLGNPRSSTRSIDSDTYDPKQALIRWVLPGGLPYAIAETLDDLPHDIRANVDVLERFGPSAVVKRRGAASCAR